MSTQYVVQFGSGNPTLRTGLTPTFVQFRTVSTGATALPPSIAEISNIGLYQFVYGPTVAISFVLDGGAAITDSGIRFLSQQLDPAQTIDVAVANLGTTTVAMGNSLSILGGSLSIMGNSMNIMGTSIVAMGVTVSSIVSGASGVLALLGNNASSYGDNTTNPTTVFGYLRRAQQFGEGDAIFTKATGVWDVYPRGVTTTLLLEKVLDDNGTLVTKV